MTVVSCGGGSQAGMGGRNDNGALALLAASPRRSGRAARIRVQAANDEQDCEAAKLTAIGGVLRAASPGNACR